MSAIIPAARQKPPPPYRTLAIGALLQRLPRSLHHCPGNRRAKGQDHVDLGPSFFSGSVVKRTAT